ncbi:sulfotransferase [Maricaulis sp.]|uniref:sulfotransferase n=1 Tax=Maricaulis sp. TaxID=1486257 RepID=UPI001B2664E1|nr:sulfotransferase [Maricaulis sp.]MBO6797757.1 sulfotransferase [Maricaulis sp.]
MTRLCFITGAPRSGTSLLINLLGQHQEVRARSQPAPLLPVGLKAEFLKSARPRHWPDTYPLADQQFASFTPPEAFTEFLQSSVPARDFWTHWLDAMVGYSGQYTAPQTPRAGLGALENRRAIEALAAYIQWAAEPEAATSVIAWKEVFGEELLPAWLAEGHTGILVIRDPRDSINSQLTGRGEDYAGASRPLLYLCRQWRKSALYALALEAQGRFHHLRYEDLVKRPTLTLKSLSGLDYPENPKPGSWDTNSSFEEFHDVSTSSIGRHRQHMREPVARFIDALCFEEMTALGYTPDISANQREAILRSHPFETDPPERTEMRAYQWTPERLSEELERLAQCRHGGPARAPEGFIFPNLVTPRPTVEAT